MNFFKVKLKLRNANSLLFGTKANVCTFLYCISHSKIQIKKKKKIYGDNLKKKNPVIIKFLCIVRCGVIYLFHRIGLVGAIS